MTFKPESASTIAARFAESSTQITDIEENLELMARSGGIFRITRDGEYKYMLHPWLVGMFEIASAQLIKDEKIDLDFLDDNEKYVVQGFGLELAYSHRRGYREIPIEQAITPVHAVAAYDELQRIIEDCDGKMGVIPCVCKTSAKMHGKPCKQTSRLEVCMAFRDMAAVGIDQGVVRETSKAEMLEIARQSEAEGLVLQAENTQNPNWICACCGDCCGLLRLFKIVPRAIDFVESNYFSTIDEEKCVGCGTCAKRCPLGAIVVKNKKAHVNRNKCIGCGVCASKCGKKAARLEHKPLENVPPIDYDALMEEIYQHKKTAAQKAKLLVKALLRIKQ